MSDQTDIGIHAWAGYLPRWRMARSTIAAQVAWMDRTLRGAARGQRTVANWDEDALTMAVAAGRRALARFDGACGTLVFASTTAPFADRSNSGLIAEALSLSPAGRCQDVSGSQRAATSALYAALENRAAQPTLLVAADRRNARPGSAVEMRYGDAAAALVVAPGAGVARYVGGRALNQDLVHQYRSAERDVDYVLEDRWVRDVGILEVLPQTIAALLADCGVTAAQIDHLVLPVPARHARKVCDASGIDGDALCDDLAASVGDSGVGHALLQLGHVLDTAQPGQLICVAGFGQGCDVLLLRATAALANARSAVALAAQLDRGELLDDYLKLPVFGRQLALDRGIRAEADKRTSQAAYFRRRRDINAMRGSVCDACGTPHFPRARVCVACQAIDAMSDYGFADREARLKTFTEDWLAATPSPPLCYGNVEFDGGGNAFLELTDVTPGTLRIGARVAMQFRIKDFDELRGFRRYFWKPAPLPDEGGGDG